MKENGIEEKRLSIEEILYKLLGEIEPYGSTSIDKERYKNIENYYIALSFIINKLHNAALLKKRKEASINEIAQECYLILREYGIGDDLDGN